MLDHLLFIYICNLPQATVYLNKAFIRGQYDCRAFMSKEKCSWYMATLWLCCTRPEGKQRILFLRKEKKKTVKVSCSTSLLALGSCGGGISWACKPALASTVEEDIQAYSRPLSAPHTHTHKGRPRSDLVLLYQNTQMWISLGLSVKTQINKPNLCHFFEQ